MAVKYVGGNSGGGLLGGLGAIATLGGTLLGGIPSLAGLGGTLKNIGIGAGLANSMMNGSFGSGGGGAGSEILSDFMKEILGDWIKPTQGNIAKLPKKTDEELYNSWGRFDPYAGRRYF